MLRLRVRGAPAHAKCTVNPATAALGGATVVTVTVTTGLQTGALDLPGMPWNQRAVWLALLVPVGLVLRRRRWLLGLVLLAGCSTGRLIPDSGTNTPTAPIVTPSGTYTLVVAGSSAGLVRSVNLTLVVQ